MVSDCGIKMQTQVALIPKFTLCGRPHQLLDPVQLTQGGGCSVASETTCSTDSPSEDADTMFLSIIHPSSLSSDGVIGEGTGVQHSLGFPGGSVVECACSAGAVGLISESGRSPGKEIANHCSILAWGIPWIEEPGGQQSTGLQRVKHNLVTKQQQHRVGKERLGSAQDQSDCALPHFLCFRKLWSQLELVSPWIIKSLLLRTSQTLTKVQQNCSNLFSTRASDG